MKQNKTSHKNKRNSGFSLVELSVSLTIIGLLVAGVMSGKELIGMSELRSGLSESQEINSAIKQFELTYNALPGDMDNADEFWSSTSNGNNDGEVDIANEQFLAIQHLGLAKLIDGEYIGKPTSSPVYQIEKTVIKSNLGGGSATSFSCCGTSRGLPFKNKIHIFGIHNGDYMTGAITPVEALWLDNKTDDGIPDTGKTASQGVYNTNFSIGKECFSGTGKNSKYYSNDDNFKEKNTCSIMFAYDE